MIIIMPKLYADCRHRFLVLAGRWETSAVIGKTSQGLEYSMYLDDRVVISVYCSSFPVNQNTFHL